MNYDHITFILWLKHTRVCVAQWSCWQQTHLLPFMSTWAFYGDVGQRRLMATSRSLHRNGMVISPAGMCAENMPHLVLFLWGVVSVPHQLYVTWDRESFRHSFVKCTSSYQRFFPITLGLLCWWLWQVASCHVTCLGRVSKKKMTDYTSTSSQLPTGSVVCSAIFMLCVCYITQLCNENKWESAKHPAT